MSFIFCTALLVIQADISVQAVEKGEESIGGWNRTEETGRLESEIDGGRINDILWMVDEEGNLTISGTGNYSGEEGIIPPWAGRNDIIKARVEIRDITSTYGMFYQCENLSWIDVSGTDLGKVSDTRLMYEGCVSLSKIQVSPAFVVDVNNEIEAAIESRLEQIYSELGLSGSTEIKKIEKIYDYVTHNVSFDNSKTRHSAYSALIERTAACEGYARLLERMMNDNGISCKYIEGIGFTGGGNFDRCAWNIVKYKGQYYNMDAARDSANNGSRIWFMKSETDFEDHVRDAKYRTKDFLENWPMAEKSYGENIKLLNHTNDEYIFHATGGGTVSTSAADGKIAVIIFGNVGCWNTRNFLNSLKRNDLCRDEDIKVIYADAMKNSEAAVTEFKTAYGTDNMYFCFDSGSTINRALWQYYKKEYQGSLVFPLVVVVDAQNTVRFIRPNPVQVSDVEYCIETIK